MDMARPARRLWRAFAALFLMVLPLVGSLALASPASAAVTPTAVGFAFSPASPIDPFTVVTLHAVVTPSSARGYVRFLANGVPIASQIATQGDVLLSTTMLPIGTLSIVAEFVPSDTSAFQPSLSASHTLVVLAQPRAWLLTLAGVAVPAGGQVRVPSLVRVSVDGFAPNSVVAVRLGETSVSGTVHVDASGAGSTTLSAPSTLGSNVYLLTAAARALTTSFVFYVYNPGAARAAPAPSVVGSAPAAAAAVGVAVPAVGIPATGATPSLAHTGSDVVTLLPLAILLLVLGGACLSQAGAAPLAAGRHARLVGAHARI
jgi:hypothetical protein